MRAIVHFHNGFTLSPGVHTNDDTLMQDIKGALDAAPNGATSGQIAAIFAHRRHHYEDPVELMNVERTGTYGIKRAFCEGPGYWPGSGDQTGVIFVNIEDYLCEWWGGKGFDDGDYNAAAVRHCKLDVEF